MSAENIHGGDAIRAARELGCSPDEIRDFSANINPRGLPRAARAKLLHAAQNADLLLRYPDWETHPIRSKLAERHGVPVESIVLGAGAAALITDAIRAINPASAIAFVPGFAEYKRACAAVLCPLTVISLNERTGFTLNTAECVHLLEERRPDLLILNNPHNPSGSFLSAAEMNELFTAARQTKTAVVVDEAFIDYAPNHAITSDAAMHERVIAIRSLTKFYGCPGLRIGYAVAHPALARRIQDQQPAWPVGSIALDILDAAISDSDYVTRTLAESARERDRLSAALVQLGLTPYPSHTNFLLVKLPGSWPASLILRDCLVRRYHLLIRNCDSFDGLERGRFIRLAVLDPTANARLVNALAEIQAAL